MVNKDFFLRFNTYHFIIGKEDWRLILIFRAKLEIDKTIKKMAYYMSIKS
jgi:hypothetical protein